MIVLTDGLDNSSEPKGKEPVVAPNLVEGRLREAFGRSDIEINVIGFKAADAVSDIQKQFAAIQTLPRPGRFAEAADVRALADALNRALRPVLTYSIEAFNNVPVVGPTPVDEAATGDLQFRPLQPLLAGAYKITVDAGGPTSSYLNLSPATTSPSGSRKKAGGSASGA